MEGGGWCRASGSFPFDKLRVRMMARTGNGKSKDNGNGNGKDNGKSKRNSNGKDNNNGAVVVGARFG